MLTTGKILNFNLTRGFAGEESLPEQWYRQWLGGPGLALAYLAEDLSLRSPLLDEPLFIMAGPLTGLPLPGAATACLLHFDQNTKRLLISQCQGDLPLFLKLAGYDGLVISGRSPSTVRLAIDGREAVIARADDLRGAGVIQTEEALLQIDGQAAGLVNGPVGETGLVLAGVVLDGFRQAGLGLGAVLGGKNLKAITVSGRGSLGSEGALRDLFGAWPDRFRDRVPQETPVVGRRSCPACPQGCWVAVSDQHRFIRETDLAGGRAAAPGFSLEDALELNDFCLEQGFLFSSLVAQFGSELAGFSGPVALEKFGLYVPKGFEDRRNEASPALLLAGIQGGYLNPGFSQARSIDELLELENLRLGQSCLGLCEHWTGDIQVQLDALSRLGQVRLDQEGVSRLGEKVMARIARLAAIGSAIPNGIGGGGRSVGLLPRVLVKNPQAYFEARFGPA